MGMLFIFPYICVPEVNLFSLNFSYSWTKAQRKIGLIFQCKIIDIVSRFDSTQVFWQNVWNENKDSRIDGVIYHHIWRLFTFSGLLDDVGSCLMNSHNLTEPLWLEKCTFHNVYNTFPSKLDYVNKHWHRNELEELWIMGIT